MAARSSEEINVPGVDRDAHFLGKSRERVRDDERKGERRRDD